MDLHQIHTEDVSDCLLDNLRVHQLADCQLAD